MWATGQGLQKIRKVAPVRAIVDAIEYAYRRALRKTSALITDAAAKVAGHSDDEEP